MNYKITADNILQCVGGKENIAHLAHCSTRVRLSLVDDDIVDYEALGHVDGVIGVRRNVQCQIIIGNEVVEVYEALAELVGIDVQSTHQPKSKQSWGAFILDFVISIFQPLVPAIAGGGVLKSILMLLAVLGLADKNSNTFQVLDLVGTAPLYFLPLLVAATTATKLKVNMLVAISTVSALLLPNMSQLLSSGITLGHLPVQPIAYASQVFPAILCVLFYALIEKRITQYSPKAIRIFFVPMVSMAITVPVTLLLLGPIGYYAGELMATVILFLFAKLGFVATALLAAILPFMIAAGMHKALIPYAVASFTQIGKELLYLPASLAHNISQSGASFAVALKTQDSALRSTAISAGISAFFGITEPAIYGVTLIRKQVLYSVMLGGAVGGAFIGFTAIEAFALVGPGIASITMFTSPDNAMNLVYALIAIPISFFTAFAGVLIMWRESSGEAENQDPNSKSTHATPAGTEHHAYSFCAPVIGKVIPLEDVKDEVFASKMVGDGIAVIPTEGVLYAPIDGEISSVYETGHAINMMSANGAELLFHIGINTVELEGKFFSVKVKPGDEVNAGDELIRFDLEAIVKAGYDPTVMAIVANYEHFQIEPVAVQKQAVDKNQTLFMIEELV
ncbi:PTS beta-glucoside transporter subunit IIBCA [Vibrio sp. CAIM 722]|uniref:PTS beta-glucoside transporter subunit IIBCA n=1 Tax=Vibrio eleionomae TaxID=2653505 RepID=A0A7X4RSV9_9VIBR|nr:beta-glucoside-specific PTS transporter subunit IIABC [Vibrio eleionomae]MZI92151.1 PTS beta-glucoside transporter subunit IIBCA [Vibrio eleionomae]